MRMLERCDLRHLARQDTGGWVYCDSHPEGGWKSGIFGCVRLDENDPRLPKLLGALEAAEVVPTVRTETRYSKVERDTAPWLIIRQSTTMLVPDEAKMEWDLDDACPSCGAGAKPVSEIVLRDCVMPKTGFAVTCRNHFVVVHASIAHALQRAGLEGFRVGGVRRGKRARLDPSLRWIDIQPVMPSWSKRTRTSREGRCSLCDRTGHYHSNRDDQVWYSELPKGMRDFNQTREQFGGPIPGEAPPHRGGGPAVILSQRARVVLVDQGARVAVQPLMLESQAL